MLYYIIIYMLYYQYNYVFVRHSVDEISLGQTVALFLKFETMHSFPEAMVSRYLGWKETMQRMGVNRDAFEQFMSDSPHLSTLSNGA